MGEPDRFHGGGVFGEAHSRALGGAGRTEWFEESATGYIGGCQRSGITASGPNRNGA